VPGNRLRWTSVGARRRIKRRAILSIHSSQYFAYRKVQVGRRPPC
jgi:hypothetical protein